MITKPTGPKRANIFLIGEAPAENEQYAWTAGAGRLLDEVLLRAGIERDDCFVTNLLSVHLPHNSVRDGIYDEEDRFVQELRTCDPLVIIPMGRWAARWFLGDVDMESIHGIPHKVVIPALGPTKKLVIPVYNPAYGLHDDDQMAAVLDDFRRVADLLDGGTMPDRADIAEVDYKEGFEWLDDAGDTIYMDTEGWADRPYCVTYSVKPGWARLVKATDKKGLHKLKTAMAFAKHIVLHNCLHDIPVLEAMGLSVRDEQLEDTMIMAYNLQIEPQGLKALALRYAGMEMGSYTDLTRACDRDLAMYYLETVVDHDWGVPEPELEQDSKTGEFKCKQPRSVVSRVKSILKKANEDPDYDPKKAWNTISDAVRMPIEGILGPLPETTLDMVAPDAVLYYACRDADATGRVYPHMLANIKRMKLEQTYRIDMSVIPMVAAMHKHGIEADVPYFEALSEELADMMESKRLEIMQHNGGAWINPDSPDQVSEMLFGRLRLISRKRTKKGKLSTQDKALEDMRTQHPAVGLICDYREYGTLLNDFARKIPRFVQADSRVRCTFRITRVVSGRLSATNPNLMAIPTRGALGPKIRNGFKAADGWVLMSADLSQIEMKVMAALSGDKRLLELFANERDIHLETASKIFNTSTPSKDQRTVGKRCGFGVITGISGKGLWEQMRLAGIDTFTAKDCDKVIEEYFKVYPGIKSFLAKCRAEAHREGLIRDAVGRVRYLPGVWSYEMWKQEESERQSHSHVIQATAQGLMKIAMADIWAEIKGDPNVKPLLQIHDEVILEVRKGHEERVKSILHKAMTRNPFGWPVRITTDINTADRWGGLK